MATIITLLYIDDKTRLIRICLQVDILIPVLYLLLNFLIKIVDPSYKEERYNIVVTKRGDFMVDDANDKKELFRNQGKFSKDSKRNMMQLPEDKLPAN